MNQTIKKPRILTFGEILLRLTSPCYTRLFQKDSLNVTFCGSEANVAVSLAIYGLNSSFITKVPDNDIGHAAVNSMRYFGVDINPVIYGRDRMGLYYLEKGASQRASKIIYDRTYSAIALAKREDFNWDIILEGYDWFHWTGINPALSENVAEICMDACIAAKKKGITVSCDLNYRGNLWSSEKAQSVMKKLMPFVDICIANEEDVYKVLGVKSEGTDVNTGKLNKEGYVKVASDICQTYGFKYAAITLRESYSASDNGWSAMIYDLSTNLAYYSKKYDIHIVDRVGSGDSFAAGIIYGLITGMAADESVEFATAASCLKHTIEGDYNRVSIDEVVKLVNSGGNGRVQR